MPTECDEWMHSRGQSPPSQVEEIHSRTESPRRRLALQGRPGLPSTRRETFSSRTPADCESCGWTCSAESYRRWQEEGYILPIWETGGPLTEPTFTFRSGSRSTLQETCSSAPRDRSSSSR